MASTPQGSNRNQRSSGPSKVGQPQQSPKEGIVDYPVASNDDEDLGIAAPDGGIAKDKSRNDSVESDKRDHSER
jgi:hypothetical protein